MSQMWARPGYGAKTEQKERDHDTVRSRAECQLPLGNQLYSICINKHKNRLFPCGKRI